MRGARLDGPILFAPVLRIAPVDPPDLPPGTLLFTSRHGAERAARLGLRDRRAIAVGDRTARIARALGFDCETGPGNAAALIDLLAYRTTGPLLHLHGRHVTSDLAAALRGTARAIHTRIVYDQIEQPLTAAARAALSRPGTVLPLYSVRSARLVAGQLDSGSIGADIVAISESVARAWPFGGPVHIAERSDGTAIVARMASLVAAKGER